MEIHHHNKDVFYLAISFKEARLMLQKDEETLCNLACYLEKAVTWLDDNKLIFTKRLFEDAERARLPSEEDDEYEL